jgi:tryprostatin B 6-hydroxylase
MTLLVSGAAFTAGIAAHPLYFKRSEHHLYPIRYLATFLLAAVTITIAKHHFFDTALVTAVKSSFSIVGLFVAGTLLSVSIYRLFPVNGVVNS